MTIPNFESIVYRLRFKHFKLLVAIDEVKSLLKAADLVAMTQPAASKLLKEIEEAFGQELFTRTNQGLEANSAGFCAIRYAHLILNDLRHLRDEISNITDGYSGHLSVGATMGGIPLITEALTELDQTYPNLNLQILEGTSFELLKWLDEGRIELALCRINMSEHPEKYATETLDQEEIAIIAHNEHIHSGKKQVRLSDVSRDTWIMFAPYTPLRLFIEAAFRSDNSSIPTKIIETTSLLAMIEILKRDKRCCAAIPKNVATLFKNRNDITLLDVKMHKHDINNLLVNSEDRQLSKPAELFKKIIKDQNITAQSNRERAIKSS